MDKMDWCNFNGHYHRITLYDTMVMSKKLLKMSIVFSRLALWRCNCVFPQKERKTKSSQVLGWRSFLFVFLKVSIATGYCEYDCNAREIM